MSSCFTDQSMYRILEYPHVSNSFALINENVLWKCIPPPVCRGYCKKSALDLYRSGYSLLKPGA